MRNNIEQQKIISIKQVKSDKKSKFSKNGIIFISVLILTILSLQTKSISVQSLNFAQKIKKAEKNVIWVDKKYHEYFILDEVIMGVFYDVKTNYVKLIFMDKTMTNILNTKYANLKSLFPEFFWYFAYSEDLVPLAKDNKSGYIDKKGKKC